MGDLRSDGRRGRETCAEQVRDPRRKGRGFYGFFRYGLSRPHNSRTRWAAWGMKDLPSRLIDAERLLRRLNQQTSSI